MVKISAELNRERVKKSMENIDKINVYLPKGAKERINALGFKCSTFAKTVIIEELERLEKMKK